MQSVLWPRAQQSYRHIQVAQLRRLPSVCDRYVSSKYPSRGSRPFAVYVCASMHLILVECLSFPRHLFEQLAVHRKAAVQSERSATSRPCPSNTLVHKAATSIESPSSDRVIERKQPIWKFGQNVPACRRTGPSGLPVTCLDLLKSHCLMPSPVSAGPSAF